MNVLVTGATGLVGKHLCLKLIEAGHDLVVLSTQNEENFRLNFSYPCDYFHWNQLDQLPKVDAVIHLAGDNIASSRWSSAKRSAILESRVRPTENLIEHFRCSNQWPKVFISTSAVGIYGDRKNELLSEDSSPGQGFLANVCTAWEAAAQLAVNHSRLVILRLGVVLDSAGGFLGQLDPLFTSSLGGPVGGGKQWMSWIHIDDLICMYMHVLNNDSVEGAYNAVAPSPITNSHFTKAFSEELNSMNCLPAPAFGLKLLLGDLSQLALSSQNVLSKKIQQTDFQFQYPNIETALEDLYRWRKKPYQQLFTNEQWVPQVKSKVFSFFSEATNLEKITPSYLKFKILKNSHSSIQKGSFIDYKLKIHGVPTKWRTKIESWNPNESFTDLQVKGPYKTWHHTHSFKDLKKGTLMKDRIIYELPLGKLGYMMAGFLVRKDVRSIFSYRTKVIHEINGKF